MKAIYKPTGKAREYGDLACNLYRGCSHGCDYCYAPKVLHMNKEDFKIPEPRVGILDQLEKCAKKHAGSRIPIFLSFTSDPYQPDLGSFDITRASLEILKQNKCAINILTKGGTRAIRDYDILADDPDSWFGSTLTYWDFENSEKHEPGAQIPFERIKAIKAAKKAGIKIWVSMEPIVSHREGMNLLYDTYKFVDLYKIGKMNYNKGIPEKELRAFLIDATKFLKKHKKYYYIKLDTRAFL